MNIRRILSIKSRNLLFQKLFLRHSLGIVQLRNERIYKSKAVSHPPYIQFGKAYKPTEMASGETEVRQYRQRIVRIIEVEVITPMQEKLGDIQEMDDVDEAEEELDRACTGIMKDVRDEIEKLKDDARQRRSNCTTERSRNDYARFVRTVAQEIQTASDQLHEVFKILRNLARQVLGWIRSGLKWIPGVIRQAFQSIRSLFSD